MSREPLPSVYVGDRTLLVHTTWGFHLYCPSQEMSITPHLALHGTFETPLANFLIRHLAKGDSVLDVGANIGVFTVLAGFLVGTEGHVLAVEPVPHHLSFLRRNVMTNWLGPRTKVIASAAGHESGELVIRANDRWGGLASAKTVGDEELTVGVIDEGSYDISVPIDRVDALVAGDDRVWSCVKIDVEGFEYQVLSGMADLMHSGRVKAVVFECIAFRMKDDWGPFCQLLRAYEMKGWTFAVLTDEGEQAVPVSLIVDHGYLYHVLMRSPATRGA